MPSTRQIGDRASDCPSCDGQRIWKHATKDGRMWRQYCAKCHGATSYKSRQKRRQNYNAQLTVRRQSDPAFRAYELWKGAKDRAAIKGIEFSLSRDFVVSAVARGRCQVTGLPFDLVLKAKRMGSFSPSIDRIDPQFGYVPGNVQIVVWIYNRAKGDGSHEDVLKLMEALRAEQVKSAA